MNLTTQTLAALTGAALMAGSPATAATLTTSGNINTAANWDTGVLPGAGETGNVNIDASWPNTANAGDVVIIGDLIFGGGSTLTAGTDIVGVNPNSVTFNDVTVNVGDDIFTGGGGTGNFIFNAGSVTNVDDDFEANGGGTITVNGGTHTAGVVGSESGGFGAQNNSTLDFLGGSVTAKLFRTTQNGPGTQFGTINVGGDATLTADAIDLAANGVFDVATDWSGSLTITGLGAGWESTLTAGATLGGNAIDSTVFANNFAVNGDTLTLVPEPSSLALLGLGGLAVARRRRG